MSIRFRLDDARRAWEARDPELPAVIEALAGEDEDESPPDPPIREGAPTFDRFLEETGTRQFRKKPAAEQKHLRLEWLARLEAPGAEVPLPDRLRLHALIGELWADDTPRARMLLLEVIATVPLVYGPWRALKRVFKEAEEGGDLEVFAALAARFDAAFASGEHGVRATTLGYLVRRAWRHLRRIGRALPVAYADAASAVLARYDDRTRWDGTWVANHILFHGTKAYTRTHFRRVPGKLRLEDRAFPDLWKRSPRPLFGLLERARSDRAREYAAEALKADFRASLREIEPAWVARLVAAGSPSADAFAAWVLRNVPRFEQGNFRELGLHDAVLRLLESGSADAAEYAAGYARAHARDLPVVTLIRLADSPHESVRKLAVDLLGERDPREGVGLDAWGRLLESKAGHAQAAAAIRKHFQARELTPDWFLGRIASRNWRSFDFARGLLGEVHPTAKLGPGFFQSLLERVEGEEESLVQRRVSEFALGELAKLDLNGVDPDFLRRLALFPPTAGAVLGWVDEGRLDWRTLGLDFLRPLAFHPDFEADTRIGAIRAGGPDWARRLAFDEARADRLLGWFRDVRRFDPAELGFDWLLRLVARGEPRYHDFAVEVMIKGFAPADFAPKGDAEAAPAAGPAAVDLGGAPILFTGKLATMQRKEAEEKVKAAGGTVASGVTAKLHYLVIGDEGSPLYGHGKKGSKQVKAEELNAAGANIRIVSETAFLKMLVGGAPKVADDDATLAGCERLWAMAIAPGPADAPLGRFARRYIRRHHPDIAPAETDRPVDPGAEVPRSFLSFERVQPLFAETRRPLRELALAIARWEFARWAPSADDLLALGELPHADVRRFVADALLADDTPEARPYRVDPARLSPAAVYRFCESADPSTRELGLRLIGREGRLRVPEELFRLTESPDRKVRAFVIRALWTLYRDRGVTEGWRPPPESRPTVGAAARKAAEAAAASPPPLPPARPGAAPSGPEALRTFLRRGLFELPPGRPEKAPADEADGDGRARLKPLPARKAKLAQIELLRDLALEDPGFARVVQPLFREFLGSAGKAERLACLVAATRIGHAHPQLGAPAEVDR